MFLTRVLIKTINCKCIVFSLIDQVSSAEMIMNQLIDSLFFNILKKCAYIDIFLILIGT